MAVPLFCQFLGIFDKNVTIPVMTRTLLVATDFSPASLGAIRFAIQLAKQSRYSLVFFHCLTLLRPTRWSDAKFASYAEAQTEKATDTLKKMVRKLSGSAGVRNRDFEFVIVRDNDAGKAIIKYVKSNRIGAICIGTRGGGKLKKLLGTHTATLIQKSPLPLFVIPPAYRRKKIRSIVYASDLSRVGKELKQVRSYAKVLDAQVTVVHYDYLMDVKETRAKLEKISRRYERSGIQFRFRKFNIDKSLAYHLLRDVKASRTSLGVLFTNQKRGWFDRLFLSSKSVDVAQAATIPLLVIPRE